MIKVHNKCGLVKKKKDLLGKKLQTGKKMMKKIQDDHIVHSNRALEF